MKNPEEYLPDVGTEGFDNYLYTELDLLEVIKKVQKDTYNEAIDDAAENATVDIIDHEEINIDNLPPKNGIYTILPIYGVDEQSILKLKKL